MKKSKTFTFRVSQDDIEMISFLAKIDCRSRSDIMRKLIHNAVQAVYREMEREYWEELNDDDKFDESDPSNIFG